MGIKYLVSKTVNTPNVSTSSGAGAPSSTPNAIGDKYYDTTNRDWYVATGTSGASDWKWIEALPFSSGVVSGGAVTTLAIGTLPTFVDGAVYEWFFNHVAATTDSLNMYINGDTTDSNYRRGYTSSASSSDSSNALRFTPNGVGDAIHAYGTIQLLSGDVKMTSNVIRVAASGRWQTTGAYHLTATDVTNMQWTSDGVGIDDGSEYWVRRIA